MSDEREILVKSLRKFAASISWDRGPKEDEELATRVIETAEALEGRIHPRLAQLIKARAEALEEAALKAEAAAEFFDPIVCREIAAAIRALKERKP